MGEIRRLRLMSRKVWVPALLVALLALGGWQGYQWLSGRMFAARLSSFHITIVTSAMPGTPVVETSISSDGVLTRVVTVDDAVQDRATTALSAEAVGQIRTALIAMHNLPGEYRPTANRTDPNYLWIRIDLSDGTSRELIAENRAPATVQALIQTINSAVDEPLHVYF